MHSLVISGNIGAKYLGFNEIYLFKLRLEKCKNNSHHHVPVSPTSSTSTSLHQCHRQQHCSYNSHGYKQIVRVSWPVHVCDMVTVAYAMLLYMFSVY